MNVAMFTNTYRPHVGGVANSVASFTRELRRRGHRVMVVAPTFEGVEPGTSTGPEGATVVRLRAIQNFNGSDFSVRLPVPGGVAAALDDFQPDLVHAHHPFLLGDTALRVAAARDLPLLFTHHTLYERYTHYVPGDSEVMKRFVVRMATEYANLCDGVVAPSESIAELLRERGVVVPIRPIPTGIDPRDFAEGDGARGRHRNAIPPGAFVVGHVGRLAPEKNLEFLARAVARYIAAGDGPAHFLVVGGGPSEEAISEVFAEAGLDDRLHLTGRLQGTDLADAYHAMDLFAFASQTETQGMVLAEAMTAGVPVVAVDAPGVREVVDDSNGRLLDAEDEAAFAAALRDIAALPAERRRQLQESARATAADFTLERCTDRLLDLYAEVGGRQRRAHDPEDNPWAQVRRRLGIEWDLWRSRAGAAVETLGEELRESPKPG